MSKLDLNFLTLRMFSKVTDVTPFMNLELRYWQLILLHIKIETKLLDD